MNTICITHIVAHDTNHAIGKDNSLAWDIPTDMKHFRETTRKSIVIMGRKTFDSIGKPLPNRLNIIVSRNNNFIASGAITTNNLNTAIEMATNYATQNGISEIFIIGGAQIYQASLDRTHKIIATLVHTEIKDADAHYPNYPDDFILDSSNTMIDEQSNTKITIKTLVRHTV